MPKLIAQSGHSMDLPSRKVSLGTGPTCDVRLTDGFGLAANHFEIDAKGGKSLLRDLESGLGTWLNGQQVQEAELKHGDIISAGLLRLSFWDEAAAEANPPAAPTAPAVKTETPVRSPSLPVTPEPAAPAVPSAEKPAAPARTPEPARAAAVTALPAAPLPSSGMTSLPIPQAASAGAAAASAFPAPSALPVSSGSPSALPGLPAAPAQAAYIPAPPPAPVAAAVAPAPLPSPGPSPAPLPQPGPSQLSSVPLSVAPSLPPAAQLPPSISRQPAAPAPAAAHPGLMPAPSLPPPPGAAVLSVVEDQSQNNGQSPLPWDQQSAGTATAPAAAVSPGPAGQESGSSVSQQTLAAPRRQRERIGRLVRLMIITGVSAAAACAVLFFSSDQVRDSVQENWVHVQAWLEPENQPRTQPDPVPPKSGKVAVAIQPQTTPAGVLPQAAHADVVRQMLTPQTLTLFSVDLRQIIPFYNTVLKELRDLPDGGEMSEAFKRYYGVQMSAFDRLTCLQGPEKDEFVMVLSSATKVDLREMLKVPEPAAAKTAKAAPPAAPGDAPPAAPVKKAPVVINYQVAGKNLAGAQIDGFTVILGRPSWVEHGVARGGPSELHEALCMYPESAMTEPGALVVVERLGVNNQAGTTLVYETTVLNLFLREKGVSRLMVTANPEVRTELFVSECVPALKREAERRSKLAREIIPDSAPVAAFSGSPPVNPEDNEPEVRTKEASIVIPDGERIIMSAVDSVARSFMVRSPALEVIFQAQDALARFNAARFTSAPDALTSDTVEGALTKLSSGIRGGRGTVGVMFSMPGLTTEKIRTMVNLLDLDPKVGLVFRPNLDELEDSARDLAVKARDYRNAGLLVTGWSEGTLGPTDDPDVTSACRKVLQWAGTSQGIGFRHSFGLPDLTESELAGAVSHLTIQKRQLTWKPGETDFRSWVRQLQPNAGKNEPTSRDRAQVIARLYNSAVDKGSLKPAGVKNVGDALTALLQIDDNSGNGARPASITPSREELNAANKHLTLRAGKLVLKP